MIVFDEYVLWPSSLNKQKILWINFKFMWPGCVKNTNNVK